MQRRSVNNAITIPYLNWVAPSTAAISLRNQQAELVGMSVNTGMVANIGMYIPPVHTYQNGLLYQLINSCAEKLSNSNVNTDHHFGLIFSTKADVRSDRLSSPCHAASNVSLVRRVSCMRISTGWGNRSPNLWSQPIRLGGCF